jgi:threonine dehydrogenase-like Zn-dependent dehydrogenase
VQAALLDEHGLRFTREHPRPTPQPGEAPVRVLRAGVCETDLQLVRGYMGFRGVPGHEFVGVAEAGRFAGRRVAGEINCPCRRCPLCRRGLGNHCPARTVVGILNRDGAFAEWMCLPEENLHPIPDSVSDDAAVFVEPLAAALRITEQLDLTRFPRAIVLGDGRLGNLCAQVLQPRVQSLRVVGKHADKLDRLERLGIAVSLLDDVLRQRDADLVVDCTGSPRGLESALQLVRPQGTIVLKTTTAAASGPNPAAVVIDEVTLLGSRCGPFAPAIAALAAGEVQVEPLITGRFPLSEIRAAFDAASAPGGLKVMIEVAE